MSVVSCGSPQRRAGVLMGGVHRLEPSAFGNYLASGITGWRALGSGGADFDRLVGVALAERVQYFRDTSENLAEAADSMLGEAMVGMSVILGLSALLRGVSIDQHAMDLIAVLDAAATTKAAFLPADDGIRAARARGEI